MKQRINYVIIQYFIILYRFVLSARTLSIELICLKGFVIYKILNLSRIDNVFFYAALLTPFIRGFIKNV